MTKPRAIQVQLWLVTLNCGILIALCGLVWNTRGDDINDLAQTVQADGEMIQKHEVKIALINQQLQALALMQLDLRAIKDRIMDIKLP